MLTTALGAGVALLISLTLNLHYALLGGSAIEGILSSRRLVSLANKLWRSSTRKKLTAEGVPLPTSTVEYAPGLFMDIYDPREDKTAPAPAVIYFHAGAFAIGFRELGAATMSWLAEHGLVGISIGYRLTSHADGLGVAGCIASAWAAYRHVRANAASLAIDPKQLVVMGDSAGGLLALSLATGLRGGEDGASRAEASELPAACCVGWACTTMDARSYCAQRAGDGSWRETPAETEFDCKCVFVPAGMGKTAAEARRQLQKVLTGPLLCFGRRCGGWLPSSVPSRWPDDHGASVSPLSHVHAGMPPTLMMVGAADATVPAGQQLMLAERARAAGARVGALIFDGADHGHGGVNSRAGRAAVLRFLHANRIGDRGAAAGARGWFGGGRGADADADSVRGEEHVEGAVRVFGIAQQPGWAEYGVEALDAAGGGWLQGKATVTVSKGKAAAAGT